MLPDRPSPGVLLPFAFISRFLHWGVVGLIVPVLSLFRVSKGLSLAELGYSTALFSAVIVALELPTGVLADRFGRKRVYLGSLLSAAASCVVLLFARGFWPVTLGFALYAVSRALSSGSLDALLIDRFIGLKGKAELPRLMSVLGAGEIAGLAAGSLAGGFLPSLWADIARGDDRYNGNLAAMLIVICVLFIVTLAGVTERGSEAEAKPKLAVFLRDTASLIHANRTLRLLLVATAVWGFAFSAVETYWQPRVAEIIGSDRAGWIFGLLSTGYFLSALAGSLAVPFILKRTKLGAFSILAALRLLTAGFVAVLAFQSGIGGFAAFYLVLFLWNGMCGPPEGTVFNLELPSERRASMLSAASLCLQVGGLMGAALFGLMAGRTSIPAIWLVAAASLGASAVLYPLAARTAVTAKKME